MSEPLIKVSREGTQIGEYTIKDALQALKEGKLKHDDVYWADGMTSWKSLSDLKIDIGPKKESFWAGCGMLILIVVAVGVIIEVIKYVFGFTDSEIRSFMNVLRVFRL